jgi:MFS family permease
LNQGIYGVIFNLYILNLGYREDALGLMLSIISISTGLFALPAAMICDRIGRKASLLVSSFLLLVSMSFLYTMASMDILLAMSMLYGIAMSFNVVAGAPLMAENSTKEDRMYLFSMNSIVLMLAGIIGNFSGGMMPGVFSKYLGIGLMEILPYRLTLALSFIAVIFTLIPIFFIKENRASLLSRNDRFSIVGSVIRSKTVRKLILINSLIGIGAGMIVPFFNVYFHNVLMASTGQIGAIFSIAQVTMIVALIILPIITERLGKVRTIVMTELLSIPFLILIAITTNVYVAGFAYIMRMTFMNMANPAITNFNMEIVEDRERATVNSLTSMGWNIFLSLSTFISGIMMANSNYLLPYMITCIVYVIAAVLYYVFFLKVEQSLSGPNYKTESIKR